MNPYSIILALFMLSGLGVTFWGLAIIVRGRRTSRWPSIDGIIEKSSNSSAESDIRPTIIYSFTVNERRYHCHYAISGAGVSPEYTENIVKKYPPGVKVRVYYNPTRPGQATLEPGLARGDWFIFALGVISCLLGALFLFIK